MDKKIIRKTIIYVGAGLALVLVSVVSTMLVINAKTGFLTDAINARREEKAALAAQQAELDKDDAKNDSNNSFNSESGINNSSNGNDNGIESGTNGTNSADGSNNSSGGVIGDQAASLIGDGNYYTYSIDGFSLMGDGYEGIEGNGKYNYGEALQKSILFYELQRSGKLPAGTRTNWRGDSCLKDGADAGLDLTGGWFDAGDNVKFNLPMSYSAAMLAWSVYEDIDAYAESGQLEYALNNIRYACDYFIKCHPEDEVYYYQVGDGGQDHSWWGAAELVETRMDRPSYCVTASNPGSCVTGETAAALASASIIFKDVDAEYSELLLTHAESLFAFADKYKSDSGYTAANGFYTSWSGFYDELTWAGAWLYLATGDNDYLEKAKTYYPQANQDYNWSMCWDDVHIGAAVLLAKITEEDTYKNAVQNHLDWWTVGYNGSKIAYSPKGLAWLDSWGSLRYATTTAFIASVYSEWNGCPSDKVDTYWDFAVSQADYALGSTGFSYMVGYGDSYPQHVHHRTAQGSYSNNYNEPATARHILVGALAGGPDANDGYTDEVSNYNTNEVACDYNAGFTGLLAKLYSRYHGQTVKNLGAIEQPLDEFFAEASINVLGDDFVEIRAYVYNESAWPARGSKDLELRYFVDLSEVYAAGGSVEDIQITTNYIQNAEAAGFVTWDEDSHIYYLAIKFEDDAVYPGGQESYKKEIQVRMRNTLGVWDNANDYSFEGLSQGSLIPATKFAVYDEGKLVYGSEPAAGEHAGQSVGNYGMNGNSAGNNSAGNSAGGNAGAGCSGVPITSTAQAGDLSISVEYAQPGRNANSISGTLKIKNDGSGVVAIKDLEIKYYFTNDNGKDLSFSCYYAGIEGSSYTTLSGCKGEFKDTTENDSDTVCLITFTDNKSIAAGDTLNVNFCISHSDWSTMDMTNDYSAISAENISIDF